MFGSNHPALGFPKDRARVLDAKDREREKKKNWLEVSKIVKQRDKGKCRCCGKRGDHVHHLLYRSHGGKDEERNCVLLCQECHRLIHAKLIKVDWGGKHPAKSVTFIKLSK